MNQVSKPTNNRLDILVNNAGAMYTMPLCDADMEVSRALFEVNVLSCLAMTQTFLQLLLEVQGMLVNNTSVNSVVPVPHCGVYNASKAAAAMLTDTLRIEVAPFKVKVVELKTGCVKSALWENQKHRPSGTPPESSIFGVARSAVEKAMAGEDMQNHAMEAQE